MPGPDTDALRQKRVVAARSQKESYAHHVALRAAQADRTDPFVYRRVFSRMMNDVGEEHVYGAPKPEAV